MRRDCSELLEPDEDEPDELAEPAAPSAPVHCCAGSQTRTVPSSLPEASMLGKAGFQLTEFTPRAWPWITCTGSEQRRFQITTRLSETHTHHAR